MRFPLLVLATGSYLNFELVHLNYRAHCDWKSDDFGYAIVSFMIVWNAISTPIRGETKTNHDMLTCFFPLFVSAAWICFAFWLVHLNSVRIATDQSNNFGFAIVSFVIVWNAIFYTNQRWNQNKPRHAHVLFPALWVGYIDLLRFLIGSPEFRAHCDWPE